MLKMVTKVEGWFDQITHRATKTPTAPTSMATLMIWALTLEAAPGNVGGFELGMVELMVMLLTPVGTWGCPSLITLTTAWPVVVGLAEVTGAAAALEPAGGDEDAAADDGGAGALDDGAGALDGGAGALDGWAGAALLAAGILRVTPTDEQSD